MFFEIVFEALHVFFYLHRPVKALICRKNKKHPSCSRQKVHASAGEMTFLDSKDRVCFLLQRSIVPRAAVVLRGEPPTAGQQPIRGQDGETLRPRPLQPRHVPTAQERRQQRETASMWANLPFLWVYISLQPSLTALLPSTGGSEVLLLKQIFGLTIKTQKA